MAGTFLFPGDKGYGTSGREYEALIYGAIHKCSREEDHVVDALELALDLRYLSIPPQGSLAIRLTALILESAMDIAKEYDANPTTEAEDRHALEAEHLRSIEAEYLRATDAEHRRSLEKEYLSSIEAEHLSSIDADFYRSMTAEHRRRFDEFVNMAKAHLEELNASETK